MKTQRKRPAWTVSRVILKETIQSFQANSNFEISAALATYGFFAFLPLLFFLGYLFGNYAIFSQKIIQGIDQMIIHMFPGTERLITKDLYFFTTHKVTWAVLGLFLVVFSTMSLTDTLRCAFHRIFRAPPDSSFLRGQLQNLRAALMMVFFFIGLILSEVLYSEVLGTRFHQTTLLAETLPTFIGAAFFMLVLYTAFQPRRLGWQQLLAATLMSAGLILVMREIFSGFIRFNPGFGEAFGSLKTLFIMILWVYSCFLVILFGAELMVNIGRKEALVLKNLFLSPENSAVKTGELIGRFIRDYEAGAVVFRQGESGDRMFYILSGSVTINGRDGLIRTMGAGEYFGEMSMLLDAPRSATVIVTEDHTRLAGISRKNFEVILRDNPQIVLSILKEMTRRLKTANRD